MLISGRSVGGTNMWGGSDVDKQREGGGGGRRKAHGKVKTKRRGITPEGQHVEGDCKPQPQVVCWILVFCCIYLFIFWGGDVEGRVGALLRMAVPSIHLCAPGAAGGHRRAASAISPPLAASPGRPRLLPPRRETAWAGTEGAVSGILTFPCSAPRLLSSEWDSPDAMGRAKRVRSFGVVVERGRIQGKAMQALPWYIPHPSRALHGVDWWFLHPFGRFLGCEWNSWAPPLPMIHTDTSQPGCGVQHISPASVSPIFGRNPLHFAAGPTSVTDQCWHAEPEEEERRTSSPYPCAWGSAMLFQVPWEQPGALLLACSFLAFLFLPPQQKLAERMLHPSIR